MSEVTPTPPNPIGARGRDVAKRLGVRREAIAPRRFGDGSLNDAGVLLCLIVGFSALESGVALSLPAALQDASRVSLRSASQGESYA